MNESFSDELISAFLDGELTAEEQALVEQTLMDSVEQRHVFEELRALRGGLQALPTHKLSADFSQRVLRKAERAIRDAQPPLSAAPVSQTAAPAIQVAKNNEQSAVSPAATARRTHSDAGKFRVIVSACAAIAAALLIALYAPNIDLLPSRSNRVALGPTEVKQSDNKPQDGEKRSEKPVRLNSSPAPAQGPAAQLRPEQEERPLPLDKNSKGEEFAAGGKSSTFEGAQIAEEKAAEGAKGGGAPKAADLVGQFRAPRDGVETQGAPADAPRSDASRENPADVKLKGKELADVDRRAFAFSKATELAEAADSSLVVIPVNCTRLALESGAFDDVLKEHQVFFDGAESDEVSKDASKEKDSEQARRQSRGLRERASAAGVDVVVVEATVSQIDGILADFQARRDQFLGVAVQPLADDALGAPLLAKSSRAKRPLARGDELLRLATQDDAGGNRAPAKEIAPPAEPGSPAGPRTALDKVAGDALPPRGGGFAPGGAPAPGGSVPAAGGLRSFTPGGAPSAPSPAKPEAPKPGPGKPGESNGLNPAEFRKVAEAKLLAEKSRLEKAQTESSKQLEGVREGTAPLAESKAAESKEAEYEPRDVKSGATVTAGRASRIASAEWMKFSRLGAVEEAEGASLMRAQDAAKYFKDAGQGKAEDEAETFDRANAVDPKNESEKDRFGGKQPGFERAAKKTAVPADAKPRVERAKQDADRFLEAGGESRGSAGKPADRYRLEQLEKRAAAPQAGQERIRVLFVIKAVEEE